MTIYNVRICVRNLGWMAVGVLLTVMFLEHVAASQGFVVPNADELRFQLIGNEPIAAQDNRALVTGWSILMIKDRKANRCYVVFKHETDIASQVAAECPR